MIAEDKWVALLLPREIQNLSDEELIDGIKTLKNQWGKRCQILAHHYQRQSIVDMADFVGDSLELAHKTNALPETEYIVFCGVQFMAEMAAALCRSDQKVITPAPNALCPIANMADMAQVSRVWEAIGQLTDIKKAIPITYVNSLSEIKAFCGENGGLCCTSSNAKNVVKWALENGERILFLPDENLGVNTCQALGIPKENIVIWDPTLSDGGCSQDELKKATAILWRGYCHVHTHFTLQQVKLARENYPGCLIVVHPECNREVVEAADESGSTSFIIKYAAEAPSGSTIIIGTELNLVKRLAAMHKDKTIAPLSASVCPDMERVTLRSLYWSLLNLGKVNLVSLDEPIARSARLALERMLKI